MAGKAKATTTRGNTYVLTPNGKKHLADTEGQGAKIRDLIARKGPITAAEISGALKQIPKANIAYYLSIWKGDGFVKFGKKPASKKAA